MTADVRGGGNGPTGRAGGTELPPMIEVVRRSGVGWYPLVSLGGLSAVTGLGAYALTLLLPEVGRSLAIEPAGLTALLTLSVLASAAVSLPLAGVVQRRPIRALLVVTGGIVGGAALILTSLAVNPAELAAAMIASGAAGAVVAVSYQPLLVELYPPDGRVRALSALAAGRGLGDLAGPTIVGGLVAVADLTWRGVFVVAGVGALAAAAGAVGLRDPGFGRWDRGRVRALVRGGDVAAAPAAPERPLDLGPIEAAHRLHTIPTLRSLFLFQAGLGAMIIPFVVFLVLFLDVRWNMGPPGRGIVFSGVGLAAVVAVTLFGPVGERLFRHDPRRLVTVASRLYGAALALVVVAALGSVLGLVVAALAAATGLVAAIGPGLSTLHLSLVPPQLRSMANALSAIYFAGPGGLLGILLFGAADRRYGLGGALVATTAPGLAAVLLLRRAGRTVNRDLARAVDEAADSERLQRLTDSGRSSPLLVVRRLRAGYDDEPVLRGVDMTIGGGECVALVGVNGAGKSTLLRTLGGLLPPQSGIVRLRGRDVTHVAAERRNRLGIVLVSGAATVFDPLSVDEHLRLYLHSAGLRGTAAESALDRIDQAFPALAARRRVAARSLSGGERQMLGISRALARRPDLLLIDELSSGLAPALLAPLVDVIRNLASEGSAVVLVEQSMDVAASICERSLFLERGTVRFDGPTEALLGRDDLLRPIFLSGVTS